MKEAGWNSRRLVDMSHLRSFLAIGKNFRITDKQLKCIVLILNEDELNESVKNK